MAGEESDEVDALVSILFEEARGRLSICGCWSTGKKLQSFFNRIHMAHRSWASSGARKHLILRRRQCPVNLSQCVSHMHVAGYTPQAIDVRWYPNLFLFFSAKLMPASPRTLGVDAERFKEAESFLRRRCDSMAPAVRDLRLDDGSELGFP